MSKVSSSECIIKSSLAFNVLLSNYSYFLADFGFSVFLGCMSICFLKAPLALL